MGVVLVVILLIVAGAHVLQPGDIGAVPGDGLLNSLVEHHGGRPAQLVSNFGTVQGVAAVVTGPVHDTGHQALRLAQGAQNAPHHSEVGLGVAGTDVIDFAVAAALQNSQQGAAVVLDVKPVPFLQPVAVDGKRLILERVGNHEGNELFRKLVRPVVIGSARNDTGKAVGANERSHQQVGSGLACRIRAVGLQGIALVGGAPRRNVAVDLVCGNVEEARDLQIAGHLQQNERAANIGVDDRSGLIDAAVHMGFGGKMHYGVTPVHGGAHSDAIADIAADKAVTGVGGHSFEVQKIAGVSENIVIDQAVAAGPGEEVVNEIGADKSGATSDKDFHSRAPTAAEISG